MYVFFIFFFAILIKYVNGFCICFSGLRTISNHYICCDRMDGIKMMNKTLTYDTNREQKKNITMVRYGVQWRALVRIRMKCFRIVGIDDGRRDSSFLILSVYKKTLAKKCFVFIATYRPFIHSPCFSYACSSTFAIAVDEKCGHESKNI